VGYIYSSLSYHLQEQCEYPEECGCDVGEEQIGMNGVSQATKISEEF